MLIHAFNIHEVIDSIGADGNKLTRGLIPRQFDKVPCGSSPFAPKASTPKIPRDQWKSIIADLKGNNVSTIIKERPIPNRNQGKRGYCWAHSTVSGAMATRAKANLPYADLSAYAIACMIKNFKDQGGFNYESMKFLAERGCPTSEFWPQQGINPNYNNKETWENAAKYKIFEFEDIPERDFDQLFTYLLLGLVAPIDLMWWLHSVLAVDPIDGTSNFSAPSSDEWSSEDSYRDSFSGKLLTVSEFDRIWETSVYGDPYGVLIWNSWGETWGEQGFGILTESRATPDGSIVMRGMK